MRGGHWSLAAFAVLLLAAGAALASSPAEDDPGMMDGYLKMQEEEARYRFEQEVRRQQGQGSILDAAAQNDLVTGVVGEGIQAAGGKILGSIPVDDIAKVAGHAYEGDTDGAVRAYATGWVGFLSGAIAGLCAKAALTGTAVALSAPAAVPVAAATVGIGVGYLAKRGFEYLLDMNKTSPAPRVVKPADVTPKLPSTLPPDVRLTDAQIKGLKSILDAQGSATPPAVPPTPGTASSTVPVLPPVLAEPRPPAPVTSGTASGPTKPQPLDPKLSPPMNPTTNPPAGTGQTAAATTTPAPEKAKPASPQPAAKPYMVYCLACKNELALPRGQKAPAACPSCGRVKVRICENNEKGQKVTAGTGGWCWPKGSATGLGPGQWCE